MNDKEKLAQELIGECDQNISSGEVNSFASYDEGVRDTLMWLFEGGQKPYIGRER